MYQEAVAIPYGFLYVNMLSQDVDAMFYSPGNRGLVTVHKAHDEREGHWRAVMEFATVPIDVLRSSRLSPSPSF